jgi:hypothetical protein
LRIARNAHRYGGFRISARSYSKLRRQPPFNVTQFEPDLSTTSWSLESEVTYLSY